MLTFFKAGFFLFSCPLSQNPSCGLHGLNMLTGKQNRYILHKSPQTQKPQVAASLNPEPQTQTYRNSFKGRNLHFAPSSQQFTTTSKHKLNQAFLILLLVSNCQRACFSPDGWRRNRIAACSCGLLYSPVAHIYTGCADRAAWSFFCSEVDRLFPCTLFVRCVCACMSEASAL